MGDREIGDKHLTPRGFHLQPTESAAPEIEQGRTQERLISYRELARHNGRNPDLPILLAVKGIVFDVSTSKAYLPGGAYHVLAGKDASRAIAKSSLAEEDCTPNWSDLEDHEKTILAEWFGKLRQKYPIVGRVEKAANLDRDLADIV